MKKIIIFLTLLFAFQPNIFSVAVNEQGTMVGMVETIPSYITTRKPLLFAVGQSLYVNGGLTFDYNLQSSAFITTGLQTTNDSDPSALYSAIVTAQAFQQATITVYKVDVDGTITEAADDEVLVTMFAIAPF